jgi:hypothetical protein
MLRDLKLNICELRWGGAWYKVLVFIAMDYRGFTTNLLVTTLLSTFYIGQTAVDNVMKNGNNHMGSSK